MKGVKKMAREWRDELSKLDSPSLDLGALLNEASIIAEEKGEGKQFPPSKLEIPPSVLKFLKK